jgi:hypothetical protein
MTKALLLTAALFFSGTTAVAAQDTVVLTLKHIGRDGQPAAEYETMLINTDTFEFIDGHEGAMPLPKGRYVLQSTLSGKGTKDHLSYPDLTLDANTEVDLDARLAKPVEITPPEADAKLLLGEVLFSLEFGGNSIVNGVEFYGSDKVSTANLGPVPPDRKLQSLVNTQWQGRHFYGLAWFQPGGIPTGFQRTVRPADLAKVHQRFGAPARGKPGWSVAKPTLGLFQGAGIVVPADLPSERTVYFNASPWENDFFQLRPSPDPNPGDIEVRLYGPIRHYEAGRDYEQSFDSAVSGPAVPVPGLITSGIQRTPEALFVAVPMFTDGGGNAGQSTVDSARTTLYQDGVKIGESDYAGSGYFPLTAKEGIYRLETGASRTGVAELSTKVSAAWTFRSSTEATGLVPLSSMRFAPRLDISDSAPAGQKFVIPVYLRDQNSDLDQVAKNLTVDVSYDSGRSWQAAQIVGNTTAVVQHPAKSGLVSLRAMATDRFGSTVETTIINAYRTSR